MDRNGELSPATMIPNGEFGESRYTQFDSRRSRSLPKAPDEEQQEATYDPRISQYTYQNPSPNASYDGDARQSRFDPRSSTHQNLRKPSSQLSVDLDSRQSRFDPRQSQYDARQQQQQQQQQQFQQNQYDTRRSRSMARSSAWGDDERDRSPAIDDDEFFANARNHPPPSIAQHSINGNSPQPPPAALLDHSHLRPGNQASLLSHERTLELYRANAKKTQDPEIQFEFAVFMIDAAKSLPIPAETGGNVIEVEKAIDKREDLIREGTSLLKRLADRGHGSSQYFLADCYANGIGTHRNRQDFDRAYPLFVLAAKHGHPDAAYRAGTCCENGWGCRRESAKAIQFYRKAAASLHPGAMYRLGVAELNGELGMSKRPKEGVKWLKRSAEYATPEFPHALHELALLHERGIDNVLFIDFEYAAELLAQAAELGYAPSAYRLGECYEYGKMGCPQDPALSIHYYNIAAQQNHRDACFALTAWYLVGSPGVLPQSDTEAFLWAKRAADAGLVKAMYAVGYFLEVGIGTPQDMDEAIQYYKRAADLGDKRALQRLKTSQLTPVYQPGGPGSVLHRDRDGSSSYNGKPNKDDKCVIM